MFPASPAEMLATLWSKTWRLVFLTGSDKIRSVMLTGQFPFKYGQFVCMACREVVSWYRTMTGRQLLPDKTVNVWDKTRSVSDKS